MAMGALAAPRLARCAEPAPPLEYQVKAAFLLNFTRFIEWPPLNASSSFDICLVGENPFGAILGQLVEGETYMGRNIAVRQVQQPVPASCQVVFVSRNEKDVAAILGAVGRGVLTVGETPGFLRAGGMIDFVVEKGRVRFDINQGAASAAGGLKLSSKLLNIARSVEQ